ncbi:MAG: chemotaxis response regulator protein-glutamate methylesterase [Firmicutes bacterium]|nr:chemotaxis response regulator protein-glutamate methylesterase [Bacillota bacterium]
MAIKVLVVDDSAFMRKVLTNILRSHPGIQVVGTARNGEQALELVDELKPDVITLDVEMPVKNGIETLEELMAKRPTPVLMISSLTQENAKVTIECLEKGAIDYIPKPSGSISLDLAKKESEIIAKVFAAARAKVKVPRKGSWLSEKIETTTLHRGMGIAIGASTGGPRNILDVIPCLPQDFPAPVFYVQHMPPAFIPSYAERLNQLSQLTVKEAEHGEISEAGVVYLAPGDYHMTVIRRNFGDGCMICLSKEPEETVFRPSVDVLMVSMASVFRDKAIGVLMTGMGRDGAEGMKAIQAKGGLTIIEDKSTCAVFGMPSAALEEGAAEIVAPSYEIPRQIIRGLRR